MRRDGFLTFRARVVLLVLAIVVPSLALIGFWLTRRVTTSADGVLRERLTRVAERSAVDVVHRWSAARAPLLSLLEDPRLQAWLAAGGPVTGPLASRLDSSFAALPDAFVGLRLSSSVGDVVWARGDSARPGLLPVRVPVFVPASGERVGTADVWLTSEALVRGPPGTEAVGAVVSALDPASGAALLALPFDVDALGSSSFTWGGEQWLVVKRPVTDPPLELVVAAPRGPEAGALRTATREGLGLLVVLGAAALALAWLWSSRLTRSLGEVARAADRVAEGDLQVAVPGAGGDEVGRVAGAFNRMAARLSASLERLAEREALAAVGQLSAELAHDIRNPLTAMRLELAYVADRLPTDSPLGEAQAAALAELERLDATVNSTLLLSRSGTLAFEPTGLGDVLDAAVKTVRPAFDRWGATLELVPPPLDLHVVGNATALERLFQNLLFNAADAVERGGGARVTALRNGDSIEVRVEDDGPGIPPHVLPRVFEPRFSTKGEGSGLGLAIAERVARAHGGSIGVESRRPRGTVFRVWLPLAEGVTGPGEPSQAVASQDVAVEASDDLSHAGT